MYVCDIVNPESGKTYRQENAEKQHSIPIGTLVEIDDGVRLFVVYHTRDCDMTPLYYLSADKDDTVQENPTFANRSWLTGGYPEYALKIIKEKDEN